MPPPAPDRPPAVPHLLPLPAGTPAPARPPLPLTPLIGRSAELADLLALVRESGVRLVTLTGPGGSGKTRLALAAAAALLAAAPGSVAFVSLGAVTAPEQVWPAICHAVGIRVAGERPPTETLLATLETRELLLLLDNFEQVLAAAPELATLLAGCPQLTALVTSREPLRLRGERLVPVAPLALPAPHAGLDAIAASPAVALFLDRARDFQPGLTLTPATAPRIAEICRRLDGLPLALELAAPPLAACTVAELQGRLEQRLPVLTSGPRDLPRRLQTMHDAIAWSYDRLTPAAQALFRQLAVFAAGADAAAIAAVCRVNSAPPAPALLATLTEASLLRFTPEAHPAPRYDLLETIREFGLAQLGAVGEADAARDRHAAHFSDLAAAARAELVGTGAATHIARDRLEANQANLAAALDWLETGARWPACLQLASNLYPFHYLGQLIGDASQLDRILADARVAAAPPRLQAEAFTNHGTLAIGRGRLVAAAASFQRALTLYVAIGDQGAIANAIRLLGNVAEYRGDEAAAWAQFERAVALARTSGDPVALAHTLDNLADAAYRAERFPAALALAAEAVTLSRAHGLTTRYLTALISEAQAARHLGDPGRARAALAESMRLSLAAGNYLAFADGVIGLADLAQASGDLATAGRLLGAADALIGRLGGPTLPHHGLHQRTVAAIAGRLPMAQQATFAAAGAQLSPPALLAMAEQMRVSMPEAVVQLSPREREVLALLVAGQTDREIGAALFIGTRTVESHVGRILQKLGVRHRGAVAVAAIAAGVLAAPSVSGSDALSDA